MIAHILVGVCIALLAAAVGIDPFSVKWWTFILSLHAIIETVWYRVTK